MRLAIVFWLMLVMPLAAADPFVELRDQMVRQYVAGAGITNPRVIQAMRATPRHEFLEPKDRQMAYFDMAIPIGHGQTISPPYIVAFMTEQLDPQPTDRVLEIGTGSGYQAAVLSPLVKEVYSIEIVEPLGERAARTLQRLGYPNVQTKVGDGYQGWPEHAPFQKIIVTCSPEKVPQPLVDQLDEGGQIIVPVGERFQQTLYRFTKREGRLEREPLQATFFVPMTGKSEELREVLPDKSQPQLAHGGFEQMVGESDAPEGWYYIRQGGAVQAEDAPEGGHVMVFRNQIPSRSAHALQSFGVDGGVVTQLELEFWVRGTAILRGPQRDDLARVVVEFYNENRAPVGDFVVGPFAGNFGWRKQSRSIRVPPNAKLAVVAIGLLGATGEMAFDGVTIQASRTR